MKKPCFLYWIHLAEHKDVSEGYVGVSTNVLKRFSEHKHFAKTKGTYPLSKAILKYGERLIVTTLLEAPRDYCLEIEKKLRPSERLGWNLAVGGGSPIDLTGMRHSDEVKAIIGMHSRRTSHTPAKLAAYARKIGVRRSEEAKAKMKAAIALTRRPWNTSRALKIVWVNADLVYQAHLENPEMKAIRLANLLGYPRDSLDTLYAHFVKNNWNPLQDPEWVTWATQYK